MQPLAAVAVTVAEGDGGGEVTVPLLPPETPTAADGDAPAEHDPIIKPAQYVRFWVNITPWSYRVSRAEFQRYAARKAAEAHGGPSARRTSPLGLPVLPPTHPFIVGWGAALLLLDLTYTAVLLPLAFAFSAYSDPQWLAFSLFVGILFTLDLVVMLHRAVVVKYMDRVLYVDSPRDVAAAYARHGDAAITTLVALSAPAQIAALLAAPVIDSLPGRSAVTLIQSFALIRGLRLVRLLVLQRQLFFGKPSVRNARREVVLYALSLLYVLGVLLTWLSCMMLAIAHYQSPPEITWLASVKGQDLTEASASRQFVAAIYFVTVTACTVGFGDVSGGTEIEQLAVVLTVIVGVTAIAFSVKSMVDALLEAALQDEGAQRVALLRDRARTLSTWARWQSTSKGMMDRIISFYQGPGLNHAILSQTWGRLLSELPGDLRGELLFQVFFKHHPEVRPLGEQLLAGVSPGDAVHVLAQLDVAPLCVGHTLCWEGDAAEHVWLLQEGELVTLQGVLPTGRRRRGPALIAPFDVAAWLAQQREQQGTGAAPNARAKPQKACPPGGAAAPVPCYTRSLHAARNCFLYRMPLKRLALVVRCLPEVGINILAAVAAAQAAG
ncbi:voltage-gated potassium channel [Raphidocelis subcapitata]|uniref:Voltage-gated potassium channel n=1 Tax=Raphidocelis subcapitata TaxID=307507 RepID=A0A2V0PJ05_9CHLO|nr:voltage-gated potassium channel [Raphidocelis subcapitata]|eukprot:GBF97890.1 voltage-gated potassium channel [Raphidocelis subcapitata]